MRYPYRTRRACRLTPALAMLAAVMAASIGLAQPPHEAGSGTLAGSVTIDGQSRASGFKLEEAVIFLEGPGLPEKIPAQAPLAAAVLDQKNKKYAPHVLAVPAGTPVEIRNSDAEGHNVHAAGRKNIPFNVMMPKGIKPQIKIFSKSEVVTLTCNIHREMRAYVLVLPNPYFTFASQEGAFEIRGIPAGRYHATLWHEKFEEVSREVVVAQGAAARIRFNLKSSKSIRRK